MVHKQGLGGEAKVCPNGSWRCLSYRINFKLTLKQLEGGQFDPPCGFSKNLFSKERVKPWFFVTFNIIISYIFPENFIETPQVVQNL